MAKNHSIEAEQAILGVLLKYPGAVDRIMIALPDTSCFYLGKHQAVYKTMQGIARKGNVIDVNSVAVALGKHLKDCGGRSFLAELLLATVNQHTKFHIEIIKRLTVSRNLVNGCNRILEYVEHDGNAQELRDFAEKQLTSAFVDDGRDDYEQVDAGLPAFFEHLDKGVTAGVPTGYDCIDEIVGVLPAGEVTIIAGRPSMGKSALGLNIIENLTLDMNIPVGFISLEMSKDQIRARMLSRFAQIPANKINPTHLSDNPHLWEPLTLAGSSINECPLHISDRGGQNMYMIRSTARRMVREHGIRCLVIDYLQLIQPIDRRMGIREYVTENSRMSKELAKELNIPIILISQLNRKCEERPNKRPMLSDLSESGAIEQDAYLILFPFRESYYLVSQYNNPEDPGYEKARELHQRGIAEVIIGKNRNGPLGCPRIYFHQEYVRFETFEPASSIENLTKAMVTT